MQTAVYNKSTVFRVTSCECSHIFQTQVVRLIAVYEFLCRLKRNLLNRFPFSRSKLISLVGLYLNITKHHNTSFTASPTYTGSTHNRARHDLYQHAMLANKPDIRWQLYTELSIFCTSCNTAPVLLLHTAKKVNFFCAGFFGATFINAKENRGFPSILVNFRGMCYVSIALLKYNI